MFNPLTNRSSLFWKNSSPKPPFEYKFSALDTSDILCHIFNSKEATPAAAELILSSGATLLQYPSKVFQICLIIFNF